MRHLRVLIVDDDPDVRRISQLCLVDFAGWAAELAGSGREALAKADEALDVILLDVMMPEMDGPTTLTHLRAAPHLAKVPVIFMTARVWGDEVIAYRQLGARGVIAKPFDPVGLPTQILAMLDAV